MFIQLEKFENLKYSPEFNRKIPFDNKKLSNLFIFCTRTKKKKHNSKNERAKIDIM